MFEPESLKRLLNNSERAEEQERYRHNQGLEPDRLYCQICSLQQSPTNMYTVSQNCDPHHRFCFHCLTNKVSESINRNEDIYCPVDDCPHLLSENSAFFRKLPNNLHNKYVIWKGSNQYLNRNQSFRESRAQARYSDHNQYFHEAPPSQQEHPLCPKDESDQMKETKQKSKKKKGKKEKKKPIGEDKYQKNGRQNQQLREEEVEEEKMRANDAPKIDFPEFRLPGQQAQPVMSGQRHTWYTKVVKVVWLLFGLPVMFLLMGVLVLKIMVIFGVMICSVVGSLGCITLIVWSVLQAVYSKDDVGREAQFTNIYLLAILELICLGFVNFFHKNLRAIYYLIIKNSWIWWIRTLIRMWAYPYVPNIFYIAPQGAPTD